MLRALSALALVATCDQETSFRTTDRGDGLDPPAAVYDIRAGDQPIAHVRVWSSGGYPGVSDEPMTHVGFQIANVSATVIRFDTTALKLTLFGNRGNVLPSPAFVAVTPLGPELVSIWPGDTVKLDSYFQLFVPPQVVARMRVQWSVTFDKRRHVERTNFVRDDPRPVQDYQPTIDVQPSS